MNRNHITIGILAFVFVGIVSTAPAAEPKWVVYDGFDGAGKGKHIANLVNLQPDEHVQAFLPVREFVAGRYIVMATRDGVIKKCDLSVVDHPLSRGIIAIALDEGDELISARIIDDEPEIFVATYEGKAIRFVTEDARAMGRPARGVRAIRLDSGDLADLASRSRALLDEGGLREERAKILRRRIPERMVEEAVRGMLPKTKLGRQILRNLRVYAGAEHPHVAQMPEVLDVAAMNPKNKRS